MAKRGSKASRRGRDVKRQLADFDKAGLLSLVQDLYAAKKDNQTFLHARLGLGEDVLKPTEKESSGGFRPTCS